MCLRFADLERKLGEIDRARAVYAHCSQMCDPRVSTGYNPGPSCLRLHCLTKIYINPIALRTAKTLWSFGRLEFNRVEITML